MIVYHGSYCEVTQPHIKHSRDKLDFGKGFYVTPLEEQAISWVTRFKRAGRKGIVNVYEFNYESVKKDYKILIFEEYDVEWLNFIINSRNGNEEYKNYDFIAGGIADDKVFNTVELYIEGLISQDEALGRLKYHKANYQMCIINQQVIDKYLVFKESSDV